MARILLLDDSPLVLDATRAALEPAGHEVTCVEDPAAFFNALATARPEMALIDVSMPMLEGDAVVWIARAQQLQACRIVLFSGKTEAELEALVHSSGADGFICKTDDAGLLRAQVADFLSRTPVAPAGTAPG